MRSNQVKVLLFVILVTFFIGGLLAFLSYRKGWQLSAPPGVPERSVANWVITPPASPEARAHIANEVPPFSADAPAGWKINVTVEGIALMTKEDLPECSLALIVGSNEGYLSAAGYTDQLNPQGKLPAGTKSRIAGVEEINGWPTAIGTTEFHSGAKEIKAYTPQGQNLFITVMRMSEFPQANITTPHPRLGECEQGLEDLLQSYRVGS